MSSPWQAVLAGLARGASGLGQRLEQRDLLEAKQNEDASERALRELVLRAQLAKAQAPDTPTTPTPQRVYDPRRGGVVDELANTFTAIPNLPTVAAEPVTPRNIDPLSEAGIAAAVDRERRLAAVRPPGGGDGLRTDFTRTQGLQSRYANNPTVTKAYGVAGAVAGLKAALAGESPLDDLSVIYETVKMFDPGSVVKENEIALTRSANSLPAQVSLLVEGWRTGKKLTPQMRQWVQQLMDRKVAEGQATVAPIQKEAGAMARRYGVSADSAYIAPDPFAGIASGAPPVNLSPTPQGSAPRGLNRGPNVTWQSDNRTPDQKDWDDAVAIHGREKVLKEYGPRP